MSANHLGRLARVLVLLASLAAAGCGGENLISGFGNNDNVIGADVLGRLADELADMKEIPRVSDDDLRAIYASLREKALQGEPKAALVMLLVAGEQREPQ